MRPRLALSSLVLLSACGDPSLEVYEAADGARESAPAPPTPDAREPRVVESADGLVVRYLDGGSGPRARTGQRLRLHYRGTVAATGEVFRSTLARGIPEEVVLGRGALIPGLERALLGMRAGARAEIHVPAALAYGDAGLGAIPPGADLDFELDLLAVR